MLSNRARNIADVSIEIAVACREDSNNAFRAYTRYWSPPWLAAVRARNCLKTSNTITPLTPATKAIRRSL